MPSNYLIYLTKMIPWVQTYSITVYRPPPPKKKEGRKKEKVGLSREET